MKYLKIFISDFFANIDKKFYLLSLLLKNEVINIFKDYISRFR